MFAMVEAANVSPAPLPHLMKRTSMQMNRNTEARMTWPSIWMEEGGGNRPRAGTVISEVCHPQPTAGDSITPHKYMHNKGGTVPESE